VGSKFEQLGEMTHYSRAGVGGVTESCKAYQQSIPQQGNSERPIQIPPTKETAKPQKSSGTGFFVSNDGYLITNAHVVDSCETLKAIDSARTQFPLRVVNVSKSDDLALLKANTKQKSVAVFRDSARISQGETVIVYGYPLSGLLASTGNVSTGLVTALAGLGDDIRQMQISAPLQPGNSGGPLVDTKGAVIGVVVAKLDTIAVARITADIPQNINFAIKASAVTNLLDANSVKYDTGGSWRDLSVETLTQQMKEYTVKIECN
jgi:serine protease Do